MNTVFLLFALLWAPPTPPGKPAAPPPPPVLQGTVKGPDAKPIDKALVLVRPLAGRMGESALITRTDATGAFRLPLTATGLVNVRVEAAGLAARTLERVSTGTPLQVVLQKGKHIEGVVRDGATGQPVAGARVEARPETGALWASWEAEAGLVQGVTDAKGAFRLEGVAPGRHLLSAAARGYGRASRPVMGAGARVELFLFPGASLRGLVKDPQNRPLPGVMVRLEGGVRFSIGRVAPRATDSAGRFEFLGVEPGTYQVLAHHKDWAIGVLGDIVVDRQRDVDVDLRLEPGRRVTGRLVDADERPLSGRVAFDTLASEGPLRSLPELLRAEIGADGRFTIERLPTGDHALSAEARGYGVKRVEVQVRAADREVRLGDVVLEPGAVIRGRVRDKAGLAIAGARIFSFAAGGMRAGGPVETLSEADGAFVLAGLQGGSYRIEASAPGYGDNNATARTGAENVDIVLEPAGSITGQVVDEAGRAVESFRASANPTRREQGRFGMSGAGDDALAGDGRFTLPDLPTGEYVVEVTAPEKGRGVVSAVKVAGGSTTDVGRVVLKAGATVRGQVVDTGGGPVAGAEVSVSRGGDFGRPDRTTGSSDASGSFEIRGVTPGVVTASATHPHFAPGQVVGLEVDVARPAEARIVLTQGGRIEGTARRRGNLPIAGAQVQVMPERGRPMFGSTPPAMTGPDGSFLFEHVPAGRLRVVLMARESASTWTSAQSREVDVQEGQTSVIDFVSREILLSGTVRRSGVPLPGVRLSLRGGGGFGMMMSMGPAGASAPVAGPQRLTAVTREDGSYEMLVDEPGRCHMEFETTQGGNLSPRPLEVPDAEAFSADFDFSGILISGVVVDKETEAPIAEAGVYAIGRGDRSSSSSDATTGADGRFQLEVDAGEYRVSARAQGYGSTQQEVSVTASGTSDVRLALARGSVLRGKVLDVRGRPVSSIPVWASSAAERSAGFTTSLADGSFTLEGLAAESYVLFAGSRTGAAYGMAGPLNPGAQEAVVRLRPAGRVQVLVLSPDGTPVKDARARVATANGHGVGGPLFSLGTTAENGIVELETIAATVQIEANAPGLEGTATTSVPEGGTTSVEIKLQPAKSPKLH